VSGEYKGKSWMLVRNLNDEYEILKIVNRKIIINERMEDVETIEYRLYRY